MRGRYPAGGVLHLVRRVDAEQTEGSGDRAAAGDGEPQAQVLELARLRADDLAVAVEGREDLRELERVGRDAVRRPAVGRLRDLVGPGEQLLDQGALGRMEGKP